jgi:hypothetical protein
MTFDLLNDYQVALDAADLTSRGMPGLSEDCMALSRSWVLLVNSARRAQPACLYFNALRHSSASQIRPEIAYSWPM